MNDTNRFSLLRSVKTRLLKSTPLAFPSIELETPPDISAVILEFHESKGENIHGILGEIIVESDTARTKSKTKIAVREKTSIISGDDQGLHQVNYSEMQVGQKINIWFPDQDYVKSYGSGVAQQIEILNE